MPGGVHMHHGNFHHSLPCSVGAHHGLFWAHAFETSATFLMVAKSHWTFKQIERPVPHL